MPWGAAVGAGISLIGQQMQSDKNGGAGTQTNSKEPWLMAQPWLLSNMSQGQALQDKYTAQPFSPQQRAAYDNSYALTDYGRALVPSLLNQMQGQQVGFDKANPTAKQKAWDWNAVLGDGSNGLGQKSVANAKDPAAEPAAAKKSDFVNLDVTNPNNAYIGGLLQQNGAAGNSYQDQGLLAELQKSAGGAGYGDFKYGMAMPKAGTQAYRDMQEYMAYGGADPYNLYGVRKPAEYTPAGNI